MSTHDNLAKTMTNLHEYWGRCRSIERYSWPPKVNVERGNFAAGSTLKYFIVSPRLYPAIEISLRLASFPYEADNARFFNPPLIC
jgi:hypothetical protein